MPDSRRAGQADPWIHVHRVVARSGTSFLPGMRVLSPERRRAMYAIYAFCREVDDIADEPGPTAGKRQALAAWRDEVSRLYEGRPIWPTTRALLGPVQRFDLPQEEFLTVIEGMETDIARTVRMQELDDLLVYCRRVAGAVGMLLIRTFGVPQQPGPRIAEALGNALQLTNILRDLSKDAALERIYVPVSMLARHGVAVRSPDEACRHPGFANACAELAELARGYYADADCLLAELGYRRMRPAVVMMKVYATLLDRLERRGWDRIDVPVRVPRTRRAWLALRYGAF